MKCDKHITEKIIGLVSIIFLALKIMGLISWSWLWVFAPIWIPLSVPILISFFIVFRSVLKMLLTPSDDADLDDAAAALHVERMDDESNEALARRLELLIELEKGRRKDE